ncbi:MAG: hypothetical protein KDE20_29295, partial [Caldilineaceae bacterium]|nr:hypothetical protein [Caldilineaceae bacterium]
FDGQDLYTEADHVWIYGKVPGTTHGWFGSDDTVKGTIGNSTYRFKKVTVKQDPDRNGYVYFRLSCPGLD